jgi:hypothetical protein
MARALDALSLALSAAAVKIRAGEDYSADSPPGEEHKGRAGFVAFSVQVVAIDETTRGIQ